tara:strand:- start:252 stop:707 length:456 start_codon:yes stop_codon:yes gene_type:complete
MVKTNKYLVFLYFFSITVIITYAGTIIKNHYFPLEKSIISDKSLLFKFFIAVVLAPIYETFIFQYIPIKIIGFIKIKKKIYSYAIAILASGLLFGIVHAKNPIYAIFGFIVGCIFAYMFILFSIRKDFNPFLAVVILHGTVNLFGLLFVGI